MLLRLYLFIPHKDSVRQILLSLTIVREEGELIWKVADWGSNPELRYWATTTRLFCQFRGTEGRGRSL